MTVAVPTMDLTVLTDEELQHESRRVKEQVDALYWTFTREKRGVPPVLSNPALHIHQRNIEREIAARRQRQPTRQQRRGRR